MRAGGEAHIHRVAQFRTCLWLRAARRISVHEAGKTPVVGGRSGSFRPLKNGPAAGGENRRPRPKRVTQLKATTERAFLVSAGFQVRRTKEACPSCRACGRGFPFQTMASLNGFRFALRPGVMMSCHTAQRHCRNGSSPEPARHGMQQCCSSRLHRAMRSASVSQPRSSPMRAGAPA